MPISPDEIKIIKTVIHYSTLLERETQKHEEFRDVSSIRSKIDTDIWLTERLGEKLEEKTEEDLIDDNHLCRAFSNALIFLTGYHHGRRVPEDSDKIVEEIKSIKEKFCKKKDHEYY